LLVLEGAVTFRALGLTASGEPHHVGLNLVADHGGWAPMERGRKDQVGMTAPEADAGDRLGVVGPIVVGPIMVNVIAAMPS
jgi:hypothetical protein